MNQPSQLEPSLASFAATWTPVQCREASIVFARWARQLKAASVQNGDPNLGNRVCPVVIKIKQRKSRLHFN